MEAATVQVSGLTVVRGGRPVLDGFDLEVGGGVTGLLGPSGCGKTTLMRALVGVQRIAAGSVRVLGQEAGSADLRTRVGYVTQASSVYDDLSVRENLRFFATVLGAGRGDVARSVSSDVARVVEEVDLTDQLDQVVGTLSGGQRSRVSLAASLLGQPDLLVLDEPTVGLDPVLREQLWSLFHRLAAAGVTVLVSSHVMDEALRCDRLLLMREGRIIAAGAPRAICEETGARDIEEAFLRLVRGRS